MALFLHQLSELTDYIKSRHHQSLQELVKGSLRVSRISKSSRATPDFYRSRFHTGKLFNSPPNRIQDSMMEPSRVLEHFLNKVQTVLQLSDVPLIHLALRKLAEGKEAFLNDGQTDIQPL